MADLAEHTTGNEFVSQCRYPQPLALLILKNRIDPHQWSETHYRVEVAR